MTRENETRTTLITISYLLLGWQWNIWLRSPGCWTLCTCRCLDEGRTEPKRIDSPWERSAVWRGQPASCTWALGFPWPHNPNWNYRRPGTPSSYFRAARRSVGLRKWEDGNKKWKNNRRKVPTHPISPTNSRCRWTPTLHDHSTGLRLDRGETWNRVQVQLCFTPDPSLVIPPLGCQIEDGRRVDWRLTGPVEPLRAEDLLSFVPVHREVLYRGDVHHVTLQAVRFPLHQGGC